MTSSSLPTRRFHVGEVLSATTGTTIGYDAEPGMYRLVEFMVGLDRQITDDELLSAIALVRESLYLQVPGTKRLRPPMFRTVDEVDAWLAGQIEVLGAAEVDLAPLPLDSPARDFSPAAMETRIQRRVDAYLMECLIRASTSE